MGESTRLQFVNRWAVAAVIALTFTGTVACKKNKRGRAVEDIAEAPKPGAPGVFDDRVVLGQFAAFRGPSAGLGTELWRGAAVYFGEINATGGIEGRRIEVVAKDDQYTPDQSVEAMKSLVNDESVFALFGAVGTPTLYAVLPELEKSKKDGLILFSNFTGAQKQREAPYLDQVFNVRAGYVQETHELVQSYVRAGFRKIGVFIQNDAYGEAGLAGVRKAVAAVNEREPGRLAEPIVTRYERGQKFEVVNSKQLDDLRNGGVEAVIAVGAYQACAGFVRDARTANWSAPIANVSFVGADTLLRLLVQYERESNVKVTSNLFTSQVVPPWETSDVPVVAEYKRTLEKRPFPTPPGELQDPSYRSLRFSFGALEGFVNAKVFAEALRRAGRDLTRAKLVAAVQSIHDWDPGLGASINFGPNDNQGFDRVWLTGARDASWVEVNDVRTFMRENTAASASRIKVATTSAPAPAKH